MSRRIAFVALLFLWLSGGAARAEDDRAAARQLFREGTQHYKLGELVEALKAFKDAYRHFEDPSLLFNIGQCERALGQKSEALRSYRTYLHDLPGAENRGEVERTIAALELAIKDDQAAKNAPPPASTILPSGEATPPRTGAPVDEPAAPRVELTAPPPPTTTKRKLLYKQWWLWTAVGVAAVGVGVGLGFALAPAPSAPSVPSTAGTFRPFALSSASR